MATTGRISKSVPKMAPRDARNGRAKFVSLDGRIRADGFNCFVPAVTGFKPETILDPDAVYESSAFLVAEIASPSTEKDDRDKKMQGYARAEVELYLFVDLKRNLSRFIASTVTNPAPPKL